MISDPPNLPFVPPGIQIIEYLGKGKSGHSYQALMKGKPVVFKLMHDEPCAYYQFSQNKVESEIQAYRLLSQIGIQIPELIHFDIQNDYLVKEYIEGQNAAIWLTEGGDPELVLSQLFRMAGKAKKNAINIDYFPTNFIIKNGTLFYIDYEINPYTDEWNLENWGLYYWANSEGLATYFRTGDPQAINISDNSGKPITAPFTDRVAGWTSKFSDSRNDELSGSK